MFEHKKPRYSVLDGMSLLCCGRARIYELIGDGKLESYKYKGRRYLTPDGIDNVVNIEKKVAMEG